MKAGGRSKCEQSFSTALHLGGGRFLCAGEDGAAVLGTGAAADLARSRWLGNRNSLLGEHGLPQVSTYPTCTCFKFGDGRFGEVRFSSAIRFELRGAWGTRTAFAPGAEIPALLRKGVLGVLGSELGVSCDLLTLQEPGLEIPSKIKSDGTLRPERRCLSR